MSTPIKNVIFAGGGSRCLWQVGFWDGVNAAGLPLNSTVDYAASTSAGCAMATACLLDRGRDALELFKALTASNLHRLWPGEARYREPAPDLDPEAGLHSPGPG